MRLRKHECPVIAALDSAGQPRLPDSFSHGRESVNGAADMPPVTQLLSSFVRRKLEVTQLRVNCSDLFNI